MKKTLALILAFLMLLSLCACGAGSKGSDTAAATESIQEAPAAAADNGYGGLASYSSYAADDAGTETEEGGGQTGTGEINPDKIIYSGEAEVETRDFDDSIAKLMEMLEQYGRLDRVRQPQRSQLLQYLPGQLRQPQRLLHPAHTQPALRDGDEQPVGYRQRALYLYLFGKRHRPVL